MALGFQGLKGLVVVRMQGLEGFSGPRVEGFRARGLGLGVQGLPPEP